jgi:hypothetical protein
VYRSTRGMAIRDQPGNERWDSNYDVEMVGEVESLESLSDVGNGGGKVTLKDGRVLEGVQAVILGTGYKFYHPFFPSTLLHSGLRPFPSSEEMIKANDIDNGRRITRMTMYQACRSSTTPVDTYGRYPYT